MDESASNVESVSLWGERPRCFGAFLSIQFEVLKKLSMKEGLGEDTGGRISVHYRDGRNLTSIFIVTRGRAKAPPLTKWKDKIREAGAALVK